MLGSWWVASVLDMPNGKVVLVSWVVLVIGSIVLHELAHGWAAIQRGDKTPIYTGHMTWNPLVPFTIVMRPSSWSTSRKLPV